MISPEEFNNLPPHLQAEIALTEGHYLHHRIRGWCKIDLYLLTCGPDLTNSFYAELWYYYDLKSVGLVRTFQTAPPLEPYVENIKIKVG